MRASPHMHIRHEKAQFVRVRVTRSYTLHTTKSFPTATSSMRYWLRKKAGRCTPGRIDDICGTACCSNRLL